MPAPGVKLSKSPLRLRNHFKLLYFPNWLHSPYAGAAPPSPNVLRTTGLYLMAARTRIRSRPRRRVYAGLTLTLVLQLTMASATAPLHVLWVHTPALSISFDGASGAAISANGSTGWRSPLHLATTMNSSSTAQKVVSVSATPCDRSSGSVADSTVSCVEVKRTLSVTAEKMDGTCCAPYLVTAVDRYSTRGTAIEWQSRLSSASPKPWRTGITRSLALDPQTMGSWWIARASNASDPLRLLPPSTEGRPPASLSYGGESFQMYLPVGSVSTTEVLPTPISVHGVTPNGGLGLVVSLNETILAASVAANSTGVRWTRHFDRMGVGRELGEKAWGRGVVLVRFRGMGVGEIQGRVGREHGRGSCCEIQGRGVGDLV